MAKKDKKNEPVKPPEPSALERELAALDSTKRAALLMLVLGEQQASDIIGYLNRDEVETLGTAMVSVNDVSQTAVDKVLDQFIGELRGQTNLGLGSKDYVEGVLKRALGPEKSASVLSRILPSSSSKGLEILAWMTPQNIFEMIGDEHPPGHCHHHVGTRRRYRSRTLALLPGEMRTEVMRRVALFRHGATKRHVRIGKCRTAPTAKLYVFPGSPDGGWRARCGENYESHQVGFRNRGVWWSERAGRTACRGHSGQHV